MNHAKISTYGKIVLSSILTACAVNFFFLHDGLAPGGLTGLALVIGSVTGIEVSLMTLLISVPMLIISTLVLGKGFGMKTIIITFLTPLFMKVIPVIWLTQPLTKIHPYLELLVSAGLGGLLIGGSISLALSAKCATGGTDVVALLIQHVFKDLKLSHIILVLDGMIIAATSILHKNIMLGLFSLVSLFVIMQTIQYFTQKRA